MAKRFFYVSLGILALAIAWNLGARSARADVDPAGMISVMGGDGRIWFSWGGEAWGLGETGTWWRAETADLPVAATDVLFLAGDVVLITKTGDVWHRPHSAWEPADHFPGSGTAAEKTSWGAIKKQFKK